MNYNCAQDILPLDTSAFFLAANFDCLLPGKRQGGMKANIHFMNIIVTQSKLMNIIVTQSNLYRSVKNHLSNHRVKNQRVSSRS